MIIEKIELCCDDNQNVPAPGIQSIISLTVLALQRYMMVSQDRQFPLSTPLSTLVTLLFIWLYTAAVSVPPLLGWGEYNMNTLRVR